MRKAVLILSVLAAVFVFGMVSVSAYSYGYNYNTYNSESYLYGDTYYYRPNYVYGNINYDGYTRYGSTVTYGDGYKKSYSGNYHYDPFTNYKTYYSSSYSAPKYTYGSSFINDGYRIWQDGPRYNTGFHRTSYKYSDSAYDNSYHSSFYYPVRYSSTYGYYNHRIY